MMKKIGIVIVGLLLLLAGAVPGFYFGFTTAPDGYTGDVDVTDATLLEIIELLESDHYSQPEKDKLLDGMLEGLVGSIDDPYTTYFNYDEYKQYSDTFTESYVGIGVTISSREEYLVVEEVRNDGPADEAGMLPNDLIIQVGDTNIKGMNFYDVRDLIVGEVGSKVTIGIIRSGYQDVIYLEMTRAVIDSPTVQYQVIEHNGKNIGYIEVSTFGDETAKNFSDAIDNLESQGIDGMVVDLRNNGGGHLSAVLYMLQEFLVKDDGYMFSTEHYSDGELIVSEYTASRTSKRDYEIVTLVNGNSASASEVFASSMQEQGNYKVIGETTFGKGTMQTDQYIKSTCTKTTLGTLDCSEADRLHISIGKWFTSDHNWVHFDGGSDGITPDIDVTPSDNELLYKLFLLNDDTLLFDTVESRVVIMQKILVIMGYDVRVDGYFDTATLDAIKDVQTDNDLTNDGIVTNETMSILNGALDTYKDDISNDTQLTEALDYFSE